MPSLAVLQEQLKHTEGEFRVFTELMKARETGRKVRVPKLKAIMAPEEVPIIGMADPIGVTRKFVQLSYDMLRQIAEKVPIIAAIHNTRCSQMRPFTVPQENEDKPGFKIKIKDKEEQPSKTEKKATKEIAQFFYRTGFTDFAGAKKRKDLLPDFVDRITRELLTIDQVAIEQRSDNGGRILDFTALDGATIYPVNPLTGFRGDKSIKFVQMIREQPVAEFEDGEILWDHMNKRSDIRHRLFGYSPEEQAIETITAFLFALAYNKEQFNTGSLPKGFVSFNAKQMGHLDQETMEELQREWVALFQGIRGQWRTPFLQHDAKWVPMNPSARDMEYNQYLQTLAAYICAVYKIDPAELGLKFDRSTNIIGENIEAKLVYSKDRGINDLLFFFTGMFNKIIEAQKGWEDFEFTFTGIENRDQKAEADLEKQQGEYLMTVNELRQQHDLPKIDGGDIILNNVYTQELQAKRMEEQQAQEGEEAAPGEEGAEGEEGGGVLEGLQSMSDEDMSAAVKQGVAGAGGGGGTPAEKSQDVVVVEL